MTARESAAAGGLICGGSGAVHRFLGRTDELVDGLGDPAAGASLVQVANPDPGDAAAQDRPKRSPASDAGRVQQAKASEQYILISRYIDVNDHCNELPLQLQTRKKGSQAMAIQGSWRSDNDGDHWFGSA